jgi:hypothetical protein
LAKTPEGLGKREALVDLSDGSTIVVHKWASGKYRELLPHVGLLAGVPTIAEQSVAEADRERVRTMEFDDQMAIATAGSALSVTPSVLKNLQTLLDQRRGLEDATKKAAPSNPV